MIVQARLQWHPEQLGLDRANARCRAAVKTTTSSKKTTGRGIIGVLEMYSAKYLSLAGSTAKSRLRSDGVSVDEGKHRSAKE